MLLIRLPETLKIIYMEVKHENTPKSILSKNKLLPYVMKIVHVERFFSLWSKTYTFTKTFIQN
jgi:hypothetical protein